MNNKKKRIIAIILLVVNLIIIKLFTGGIYLDDIISEILPCLITLLVVSIILMIVPSIIRIVNKKRLPYKRGEKICLTNSVVLFIISVIPNLITILKGDEGYEMMSVNPVHLALGLIIVFFIFAIDYYYINLLFFVENKKK